MSALPLKSYGTAQRAVVRFYGLKNIMQLLFTVKCVQCMTTKGATKKMLGKQKFASYGSAIGCSTVACAAAGLVFLHRAFTNLLKDGTSRTNLEHMLNKKLSYRRGTAQCVVSIEILPIATEQCRNYLYDKS